MGDDYDHYDCLEAYEVRATTAAYYEEQALIALPLLAEALKKLKRKDRHDSLVRFRDKI